MSVPGHRKQAIRSVNGSIRSSNNPYRDIESRGNELFQPEVLPSVPEDTPTFLSFSTKTTSPETHLKRTYTQTKPVDQKEFKIAFEESKSSYTTKEPYATRERESKSTYNRYRHSSLSDPPSVRALLSEQAYISSYEASEDINYSDTAKLTANVSEISRDYSPQPSDQSFEPSSGNPSQSYQKPTEYTSKAHNRQSLVRVATVIRKMSRRVVNVQNHDDTPRLPPLTINTRDIPKQVPKEEADIFPEEPFLPTPAPPIETGPVMELRQQETLESDSDGSTYISRDSTDIQISLAGNSCGLFSPSNRFRQLLASIICWKWTETLIMLLITLHGSVLLAVGWGEDHNPVPPSQWGVTWYQPILLIIFCCYTMAMLMRIVVYGFVINPIPNDGANILPLAFLRHSWNRIDFISVVAYWIDIALLLSQQEVIGDSRRILVFKMLSTLILLRLLNITNGNKVILQSLKKATPLLRNVAFFVLFFFIIFAIVGVQSFKGSYLRRCVWTNPDNSTDIQILQQYCGGYYQDNIEKPFKLLDGRDGPWSKGFICPSGLVCQETANPFGNTISFDNIFSSMLIVMIIAGDQSWTDRMYDMMDAEYYFACLYFIFLVIVMNFWLINLFVAVINEMFAKVREDSKHSAFTTSKAVPLLADADEGWSFGESTNRKAKAKVSALAGMVAMLRPFWVLLVAIDMIVMATKNNNMTSDQLAALDHAELGFTLAFLVEILLRLYSQRRQLGVFFSDRMNKTDTFLAFITCIIWIPPIHDNKIAYAWLTGFQILRIYRIVMVIPRLRRLMSRVLGSVYGLLNLVFFIVLATFLCAIVAFQLFEGNMNNSEEEMRFFSIYNSFAGLYQLFSGEDWTTVLYTNMEAGATSSNSAIYAIFLVLWFAFSNFVLVNMFIAVLMENFETAEEEKKKRQIQYYVEKTEVEFVTDDPIVSRWNIYRYFKAQPKEVQVKNMPAALILPVQKNTVRDFMNEVVENIYVNDKNLKQKASRTGPPVEDGLGPRIQNIFSSLFKTKTDKSHLLANTSRKSLNLDVFNFEQFTTFYDHNKQADNGGPQSMRYLFDTSAKETSNSRVLEEIGNITEERRAVKQDFITAHPTYDKAFYLFSSRNLIRKACQSLVPSSRGERTFGKSPSWYSFIFSVFIISCIITNVVLTIYNSPVYAIKNRDNPEKLIILKYIDITFMVIFTIEFIIKVIADGLLMTPNAYLLNGWNVLDLFVLITLYMYNFGNFAASTGLERVFRAFKALRALRLINLLESAKETFTAILVTGLPQIIDAMFLGLSLIIPFVLYGQNIFQGLLYNCNDSGDTITDKYSCIYEGMLSAAEPMSDDTSIYQPRVWSNPYVYSFDSFGQGLLILFEIASGEGWIDVMTSSMSIQGKDQNPEQDSSQLWGIFFMVYNLAGSVFVISLFLGVVLENFGKRNGTLYLTSDQQRWLDLKKLLSQMKPAKRPKTVPTGSFRKKCFDWAIEKRGRFYKIMTGVICLNILFLCTDSEYEESIIGLSQAKGYVYLLFILAYWIEIFIKLFGLGWNSYRSNLWNIYDLLVVIGSAITIIAAMASSEYQVNVEAQKLFMTALCFKLVQRNDGLNQLFTTMAASAYQIINVFAVWFVVMTTYAIMFMEIFGLTKYGNQATTEHINFRSYANTMTSLVRYSTGEGWNTVMHNFAVESPNCIEAINYLDSDCGSTLWAYCLFLTFNIISMYIFQAIFVAVVSENFSYIYQIAANFSLVNRDEIRKFKSIWAEFDVNRTGYITSKDYMSFWRKLSGMFDVRIYNRELSYKTLVSQCTMENTKASDANDPYKIYIDIGALNVKLDALDKASVHKRKHDLDMLYWESAMVESSKGVSFNQMLLMLAHRKLIIPEHALLVDELLANRRKEKSIQTLINIDRVKGLIETIVLRKKFLAHMEAKRLAIQQKNELPSIVVNHDDVSLLKVSMMPLGSPASSTPGTPVSQTEDFCAFDFTDDALQRSSAFLSMSENSLTDTEAEPGSPVITPHVMEHSSQQAAWFAMLQEEMQK